MPSVADVMSEQPLIVTWDTPLPELAWLMSVRSAHSALVTNEGGWLTGVVSLSDLVAEMANCGLPEDWSEHPWWDYLENDLPAGECPSKAGELMSPGLVTVHEDTDVREAAELMVENDLQRLIVVRGARPVGVVSSLDLVRGLLSERLPQCTAAT